MAKAELTFGNIGFTPLAQGLCTVGNISRQVSDGGRVRVSGATIKNKGVGPIEITVGDEVHYPNDAGITPLGFALVEKITSLDPCGRDNFDARSHSEANHTVRMNAKHQDVGVKWKLVIMVQQDDGQVGVIDPDIENEN